LKREYEATEKHLVEIRLIFYAPRYIWEDEIGFLIDWIIAGIRILV
jgi:hypothetical protein